MAENPDMNIFYTSNELRQFSVHNHRMDKRKSLYFPGSIEIATPEGLTLYCSEINQSKWSLAW